MSKKVVMDKKKFIEEHKKLINVLQSPSRKDDKKEVKEQKKELQSYQKTIKKSYYQFDNVKTRVDAVQHDSAEKTADPALLDYLKNSIESADLQKIPFLKGLLTVYRRDRGLYSGFFADRDGQVIEQFDEMTIPMLAKALMVKDLYTARSTEAVDPKPVESSGSYIKIKYGDFEMEIKKSLNNFIQDFKNQKDTRVKVMKAIQSWRRNSVAGQMHKSDLSAAQDLLLNWEKFNQEFYQILEAMKRSYE